MALESGQRVPFESTQEKPIDDYLKEQLNAEDFRSAEHQHDVLPEQ